MKLILIDFRQKCLADVEQCSSGIGRKKVWNEGDFYQEDAYEMEIDEGRAFDNGKKVSGWPMLALS